MHTAIFENWDGKMLSVTFKAKETTWPHLCKCAHAAILKAGYTTVRLALIDGDVVDGPFSYR